MKQKWHPRTLRWLFAKEPKPNGETLKNCADIIKEFGSLDGHYFSVKDFLRKLTKEGILEKWEQIDDLNYQIKFRRV